MVEVIPFMNTQEKITPYGDVADIWVDSNWKLIRMHPV